MIVNMKDYTNSQISALIDEHIHSERDRKILKYRFIDGCTYEAIAGKEDIDLSPRHISSLISRNAAKLNKYL